MSNLTPNQEQQKLLDHSPKFNCCVLAGPGTGKSVTMVAFIQNLISQRNPPKIKLVTFTRAATAELAEKITGHSAANVIHRPSTIHSFAISILLQNPGTAGFPEPLRIADKWEDRNIVRETIKRQMKNSLKQLKKLFREMAANWESLNPENDPGVTSEERARFLGGWGEHRKIYGYTLLSEIPYALRRALEVNKVFESNPNWKVNNNEFRDLKRELYKILMKPVGKDKIKEVTNQLLRVRKG